MPTFTIIHPTVRGKQPIESKALLKHMIAPLGRSAADVRDKLVEAQREGITPAIEIRQRIFDLCGSSMDLPAFQTTFTRLAPSVEDFSDEMWAWSKTYPRTPAFCSDFMLRFEVSPAQYPKSIEFISPDFGINNVTTGAVPSGNMSFAPNFILSNFFGLEGIRITSVPANPITQGAGMGTSNALIIASLSAGSILSGVNLSKAQIWSLATHMENQIFGGLTGGQEGIAGIMGGCREYVWLVAHGQYGAISRELISPQRYAKVKEHIVLVQPRKNFGKKRSAADVNQIWTNALKTQKGYSAHRKKVENSWRYAEAIRTGDWEEATRAVQFQADIRVRLCSLYIEDVMPFWKKVVVRDGGNIRRAAFRLGAGGPGALFAVISPDSALIEEVKSWYPVITADEAREMKEKSKILKGILPYELSNQVIKFLGFTEAGFEESIPEDPLRIEL